MRPARSVRAERGAGLVEYALVMALVAIGLVAVIGAFQDSEAEQLEARGARIGMPDLDATPPTTGPSGGGGGPATEDPSDPVVDVALGPGTGAQALATNANKWKAVVTLVVVDGGGNPVEGVTIGGTWSPEGVQQDTSCTTGTNGTCDVVRWNLQRGPGAVARFQIVAVSGTGYRDGGTIVGTAWDVVGP